MSFSEWTFVGFTGKRKLPYPEKVEHAISEALDLIATHTGSPLAAVSSAACGADTLFIEESLKRNLPWTLLLPFNEEEFQKDFSQEEWARTQPLLTRAIRRVVEHDSEHRDHAFLESGLRTVDECDVVLAVWDGEPGLTGGTGGVIDYAREIKRPLVIIDMHTGEITTERISEMKAVHSDLTPSKLLDDDSTGFEAIEKLYRYHDGEANRHRPWAQSLGMSIIWLHQIATVVAIIGLLWQDPQILQEIAGWTKMGILVIAVIISTWVAHRVNHAGIHHRMQAELLRAAMAIWPLPDPERLFFSRQFPGFTRLQRSLLLYRLLHPPEPRSREELKADYLANRISGQTSYYTRAAERARNGVRRWRRVANTLTLTAVVAALSVALHLVQSDSAIYPFVKLASLALPLASAALLASITARDLARRSVRYSQLSSNLHLAQTRLARSESMKGLESTIHQTERNLLLEVWEWFQISQFGQEH